MKNLLHLSLLACACLVWIGCPYETAVPIDAPSVKVDLKLQGTWVLRDDPDEVYTVSPLDMYTYQIVVTQKDSDDQEIYQAHTSMVNKTMFLNITKDEEEDTSKSYILYKLEFRSDEWITLSEVTENIDEKFTSSKDLKNFISKNIMKSYFYGKEETNLIRSGE
jgi:hypothetical protein